MKFKKTILAQRHTNTNARKKNIIISQISNSKVEDHPMPKITVTSEKEPNSLISKQLYWKKMLKHYNSNTMEQKSNLQLKHEQKITENWSSTDFTNSDDYANRSCQMAQLLNITCGRKTQKTNCHKPTFIHKSCIYISS